MANARTENTSAPSLRSTTSSVLPQTLRLSRPERADAVSSAGAPPNKNNNFSFSASLWRIEERDGDGISSRCPESPESPEVALVVFCGWRERLSFERIGLECFKLWLTYCSSKPKWTGLETKSRFHLKRGPLSGKRSNLGKKKSNKLVKFAQGRYPMNLSSKNP